jgi:SecD/SecF fusion protein
MKRKNTWKWVFVVILIAWSIYEITPPQSRDLVQVFQEEAKQPDATFEGIVQRAEQMQAENPARPFGNLRDAIGTNDIRPYFPQFNVAGERDPAYAILNQVQQKAAGKIRLGLDLQGGVQFTVEMDTNRLERVEEEDRVRMLSQAAEVLRRRVDKLGVAEPVIQPVGDNRIIIQLPGISEENKQKARENIERAAFLEFRMVHPESDRLVADGIIEPGYELLPLVEKGRDGRPASVENLLVKKRPERGLTGKFIRNATVSRNMMSNQPEIHFTLDGEGARLFADITREYSPVGNRFHRLAIVLDGELYSAPRIMGEIPGGRGQITGTFTPEEAWQLANVLENPLETPVKIIGATEVDPSLGRDSIESGVRAAIIGMVAVAVFMLVYYMLTGAVANVALLLNILILFGVLASIGATLTLPGIAGIVLTIGMAIDANVLIFERIREELNAGKSLRGAVSAGYGKAFGTIFDSNITTLIASTILIFMGTGPVQGFGVTLTIGIAASMFTALVVTRIILDALIEREVIKSLPMLRFFTGTNIDFMRWSKPAFAASWLLILVGVGYGFSRGEGALGVDFKGGDELRLSFTQKVPVDELRRTVEGLNLGEPMIQYQTDIGTGAESLRIATPFDTADQVQQTLQQTFPQSGFERLALDAIGAAIGKEIQRSATIAVMLALFGILLYVAFRYEFSFSIGAVVAIIHDVLMVLGIFFLSGRELSAPMVAAVLTIIGFSINDTIVIFDRIREDLRLGVRGRFVDVMNQALNKTLSRTVITSGTSLLVAVTLYVFGGGVINNFAFTLMVGVIVGTYSTIFIASALVLWWHKGERPNLAPAVVMDTPATVRV